MKKSKFTEEQMVWILKEVESGTAVEEILSRDGHQPSQAYGPCIWATLPFWGKHP